MSIRFGLQGFFESSAKYDIINDPEFKLSNGAYGLGQVRPPQAAVLRSAKRAPANVRRLNNISDVIFYC